jgi:hypothetical protein
VPSLIRLVIAAYDASSVSDSYIGLWNETWSPVHTESKPARSTARTVSHCSAGACVDLSCAPKPRGAVTGGTRP